MKIISIVLLTSLLLCSCSKNIKQINTMEVKPEGEYSNIKVEDQNAILEDLNSTDLEQQEKAATKILTKPNSFIPPVLCSLSDYLFGKGEKDEAAFWFYTGQLRARYDANRCADETAGQAVSVLNEAYGYQINQYGFSDVENLEKIVGKVVEFVSSNNEQYDSQWINLHGMGAFLNEDKPLSKPESEWKVIKKQTIDEYYAGFTEAMQSMKE